MPLNDLMREELERYLDGQMSGPEAVAFERRAQQDRALRGALQGQQRLDASLQRMFPARTMSAAQILALASRLGPSHAPASAIDSPAPSATASAGHSIPLLRRLGVAAALLGGVFGVWLIARQIWPPSGPERTISVAAQFYQKTCDRGFEPDWVCKSDAEFTDTFRQRFGQPLALKPQPAGTRMLGLDYTNVLSPQTVAMLTECDGQRVMLIIDKAAADNPARISVGCAGLHAFRSQIGSLVVYEITPLDQPHVAELLYQP